MDRTVGIIERDKDSRKAQAIDGTVKNKFKWVWLEKTVKVNVGGGFKEFPLSEWLRKVDIDLYQAKLGRCDRNFSKVATARGFARGLLALAKCSARCDRNP